MGDEHSKVIFISYSHDSGEHRERVVRFSERLREDGLHTELDQYVEGTPEQGWPRWMLDKLDEATHVLVICTQTYYRRFRGHEEPDKGKGVDWEGALITQEIYNRHSKTRKFVPVLFTSDDEPYIPEPLCSGTRYVLNSKASYQALSEFLLGQAGIEPRVVGTPKEKPRRTVEPLRFDSPTSERAKENPNLDPAWYEKHIRFQNKIRSEIEEELAKAVLKPLQKGFIEVVWNNQGKMGTPTVSELVNELFVIDRATGLANSEAILKTLLQGTEACFEQFHEKGKKISEADIIWKGAKKILGRLTTLAVNTEELINKSKEAAFVEVDVKTLSRSRGFHGERKGHSCHFSNRSYHE